MTTAMPPISPEYTRYTQPTNQPTNQPTDDMSASGCWLFEQAYPHTASAPWKINDALVARNQSLTNPEFEASGRDVDDVDTVAMGDRYERVVV
jgi:hypothetical protein